MASSSSAIKYERLGVAEDVQLPGSNTSNASSHSVRLTPDSGFDEDDDRAGGPAEEGMELKELKRAGLDSRRNRVFQRGETSFDDRIPGSSARRGSEKDAFDGGDEDEQAEDDYEDDNLSLLDEEEGLSLHNRRSSTASFELYTPDEERAVRWKLDTRLVLFVALLYMISFLDRSNIGNAKLAGLTTDLHLSDDQFGWLLSAFYITYILFEWMTLCYRLFPPHIYIACCVLAWGVLASLQSLASSFTYLVTVRALLGIGEAAFVGMPFFLSFFFRREELALRVGLFISAAPLAEAFASSLAFAIVSLGDSSGFASWRLLFLLEGFPACLVAVWTWFWIPDSPGTARWLNPRERKVAALRMRGESSASADRASTANQPSSSSLNGVEKTSPATTNPSLPRHKRKFQWRLVLHTLRDPKAYLTASMFFCCNVAFSSTPVFLPSIVHSMGYSASLSQALSAPPFLFAFAAVLLTSWASDRLQTRSVFMVLSASVASMGYLFAGAAHLLNLGATARYLAVYPICAGFFSAVTLVITWTVNNQVSDEGKGTGMAILNVFGQMGPLLGTRLYPDADAPGFLRGNFVCAGAMACVVLLAAGLRVVLLRENRGRVAEGVGTEGEGRAFLGGGGHDGGGDDGRGGRRRGKGEVFLFMT